MEPCDGLTRRLPSPKHLLFSAAALLLLASSAQADPAAVIAPLAERSLLLDAAVAGQRLVAVGERGHILTSDDDGDSWRQVPVPTRATLTAVAFNDARHGFAAGHDAVILRSDDGGDSWQQVHTDPDEQAPLLDLAFDDPEQGIAIGAYGLMLTTRDGGRSWQRDAVNSDEDFHLNAVTTTADGHRYIAAEAGILYHHAPGSDSTGWNNLDSPYAGSLFGAIAPSPGRLLLFGLRGHLYRSDDRGRSWTRIEGSGNATLTDAVATPDGRVVIVGHAGTVLWSDDGGLSFERLRLDGRPALSAVLVTPSGRLLGFGEDGIHPIELPGQLPSRLPSQQP